MKLNQYWSEEYGCPVSYSFLKKDLNKPKSTLKIDITNCIIKITPMGFYELWLNNKRIRELSFKEYLKYKEYVKKIIGGNE